MKVKDIPNSNKTTTSIPTNSITKYSIKEELIIEELS